VGVVARGDADDHVGCERPCLRGLGKVAHLVLATCRRVEVEESDRAAARLLNACTTAAGTHTNDPASSWWSPCRAARSALLRASRTCRPAARGGAEAIPGILARSSNPTGGTSRLSRRLSP
jgi:hypothetical protein